jgi:HAD superfamily hydrolase (TIGR01459 family)
MEHLHGFAPLSNRYNGFILDLWGVIHDGVTAFPHAVDCLHHLRAAGKRTLFLSNAPRPSAVVRGLMRTMGIGDQLYDGLLTSGDAVRHAILEPPDGWWGRLGSRVFHLGPDRDQALLDGLPCQRVARPAEADYVLNTGPDDHRNPTSLTEFKGILHECARLKLPMICANPDLEVIRGGVRVLCAGALAVYYNEIGGDVRLVGKPDPAVYQHALKSLGLPSSRVLAVGDSLRTDIAGAMATKIDACWVLGGLHGEALRHTEKPFNRELAEREACSAGVAPVATVERFSW